MPKKRTKQRVSGPTIPEEERRSRGYLRVRLGPDATAALDELALPMESRTETANRVISVLAGKTRG